MVPVNDDVFLAAACTGEAENLHLKAQAWPCSCLDRDSGPWVWGQVRGEVSELEVRGQVTFVSRGGTPGPVPGWPLFKRQEAEL